MSTISNWPKRLFKYTEKKYLHAALARGTFRLGTLHEYRDIERLGKEIGDEGEGKRALHLTATAPLAFDLLSDDPRAVHARKVLKGWDEFPAGSQITIKMEEASSIVLNEEVEDNYMYCTTTRYDSAQMQRFKYDACLAILDPEGFFTELSNVIPEASFLIGTEVQYGDRRIDHTLADSMPAAFLKPQAYEDQNEFRVLWKASSQPIQPCVIECPRALLYCQAVNPSDPCL